MEFNKPISAVVILIIAFLCIFLFALPKYKQSVAMQIKEGDLQAEYNGKELYYAKLAELLKEVTDRQEALGKINSALPKEVSLAPLVSFFQKKAAENGLNLKSIVFSPASLAGPAMSAAKSSSREVRPVGFSLNVSGGYLGLKNFLAALESSSRIFQVESIYFTSSLAQQSSVKSRNQLTVYDFRLEVKTYTY